MVPCMLPRLFWKEPTILIGLPLPVLAAERYTAALRGANGKCSGHPARLDTSRRT